MLIEFKLPELGENIESGIIAKILVTKGDYVKADQAVIELETDKAVVEVPVNHDGVINKILTKEGDEVKVNQVILLIDEGVEKKLASGKVTLELDQMEDVEQEVSINNKKGNQKNKIDHSDTVVSKGKSELYEFILPDLGEDIESGTIAKILISIGDRVQKDQSLIELETEKAVVEVPSEVEGVVDKIYVQEGDEAKVGQKILSISIISKDAMKKDSESVFEKKPEVSESIVKEEAKNEFVTMEKRVEKQALSPSEIAPAAPSVRRFAREIGVNIDDVPGSGPSGRVSIDDVKNYAKVLTKGDEKAIPMERYDAEKLPDFSKWGEVELVPMNKVREKTAKHLGFAWSTIPHVTQFDEADITELEVLRKQNSHKAEIVGGKLTITAILLKIVSAAFKVFPQFNASIDLENLRIIYKKYHNIGIAVDTDRGLLVPVVRDVDKKNIIELSVELTQIAEKARNRKLSLEDMQGGNFSISNLGGIGFE